MLQKALCISAGIVIQMALADPVAATVRGQIDCNHERCVIAGMALEGSIDSQSVAQFTDLIDRANVEARARNVPLLVTHTTIRLNSNGGSLADAITLGRLLRKSRFEAIVDNSSRCDSACVFVFAGAVVRLGTGRLGIHQPYFTAVKEIANPDRVRSTMTSVLDTVRSYLTDMNVSGTLLEEMLKTPPAAVRFIEASERHAYGLGLFDPIEREIVDLEKAQQLGIDRHEYIRRQHMSYEVCPTPQDPFGSYQCNEAIMRTGKHEPPDFSHFGILVK